MIASSGQVRSRIEELKVSLEGYSRQLGRLDLTPERRERQEAEVRLLRQEIDTLEKLAHLWRLEPDEAKIEESARERLQTVRERLAAEPSLRGLDPGQIDLASGESRALAWALGEDPLSRMVGELMQANRQQSAGPGGDRQVVLALVGALRDSQDVDTRASAAYEIGRLHVTEALPALARALNDEPLVSEMARNALRSFSAEELQQAGIEGF